MPSNHILCAGCPHDDRKPLRVAHGTPVSADKSPRYTKYVAFVH